MASAASLPFVMKHRYQLVVDDECNLALFEHGRQRELGRWDGLVARHLIETRVLPQRYQRVGVHACNRCFAFHLLFAATAARSACF
ncbi:MAG: hypothetical protein CMQ49_03215 [Gammaproteobacteria bacterium]|nr:hypothetical protein [Gammaproteobacteria bacterium]